MLKLQPMLKTEAKTNRLKANLALALHFSKSSNDFFSKFQTKPKLFYSIQYYLDRTRVLRERSDFPSSFYFISEECSPTLMN